MSPRYRADRLMACIALGQYRRLYFRRPIPSPARPGEHLEPLNPASASIII